MRVSDYMRLADQLKIPDRRRGFIEQFTIKWKGEGPSACAIGGASIASGHCSVELTEDGRMLTSKSIEQSTSVPDAEDWMEFKYVHYLLKCPACPDGITQNTNFFEMTIHLYDDHRWSRSQVADYLDREAVNVLAYN